MQTKSVPLLHLAAIGGLILVTGVGSLVRGNTDSASIVVIRERSDTIFVLKAPNFQAVKQSVSEQTERFRQAGIGGAGGPMPGLLAINIDPIEDFLRATPRFRSFDFGFNEFGYEPMYLWGGRGYAGVGNGLRLGGSGARGTRQFLSKPFSADSIAVLTVKVRYGGFLIEKARVRDKFTMVTGGHLGGGSIRLNTSLFDQRDYSVFAGGDSDKNVEFPEINAAFGMIEVHGGITYSLTSFFHIGMEVTAPVFISLHGFSPYTSRFTSVNPGMALRIVFGNIG